MSISKAFTDDNYDEAERGGVEFVFNSFPNDKFLDSLKLKEFADDNFDSDENG